MWFFLAATRISAKLNFQRIADRASIFFMGQHVILFAAIFAASAAACGQVQTASGGTTGGGGAGGEAPMADGVYTANFTLDNAYTTCSSCQYSFASNYGFAYVAGNSSYNVTDAAGTFDIGITGGNQLDMQFSGSAYTNTDGCPGTSTPVMILTLSPNSFTGAYQNRYSVQACNGHPALSCTCAYDIVSSR